MNTITFLNPGQLEGELMTWGVLDELVSLPAKAASAQTGRES
jgi:hypothetical protein